MKTLLMTVILLSVSVVAQGAKPQIVQLDQPTYKNIFRLQQGLEIAQQTAERDDLPPDMHAEYQNRVAAMQSVIDSEIKKSSTKLGISLSDYDFDPINRNFVLKASQ